ncbi:MAG TPA: hypothetical protein VF174_13980 [Micromonosporaceae bacterium]
MSPFFAVFLVLLLGSSAYAAGRLHGQLSYRLGYRFGYRQGYFDGDRGAWNRRRREMRPGFGPMLAVPSAPARTGVRQGTTYRAGTFVGTAGQSGSHAAVVGRDAD